MRGWYRYVALIFGMLVTPVLIGCAVVDKFSSRAVDYNIQAEQAQQQALLLNIIRASMRRPMQFTALQSVTGIASATGNVQSNVPAHNLANLVSTLLVSGSMSGGPTFSVPVLDTQEFYQGILNPISPVLLDYYIQQGFPPEMLFDIFILKVEVTRLDTCQRFTFQNYVNNDVEFGQFQALADYLITSGLSTEKVSKVTGYGPPISAPRGATDTAKMIDAYSKAAGAGLDIKQEGKGAGAKYRVQKKDSQIRYCFSNSGAIPRWLLPANSVLYCGYRAKGSTARGDGDSGGDCTPTRAGAPRGEEDGDAQRTGDASGGQATLRGIHLSPLFLKRIADVQERARQKGQTVSTEQTFPINDFGGHLVSFKFHLRSVEGILYYLGEITRRNLFPDSAGHRVIQFKTGLRFKQMPMSECDQDRRHRKTDVMSLENYGSIEASYACENLFVIDSAGWFSDEVISVNYDGQRFLIPRDPDRAGRTTQVFELVKQLLALNTSAKTLPATSVISVIQPQ